MAIDTSAESRRVMYEIAEALAPTWESRRADIEEVCTPIREWMLEELGLRPGDTVLELAAGTGDTGFDAAALVGERGRLITTDFSPAMLDAARRRGAERSVRNVDYRLMNAERLELDADSVDGVLCRFGYMLMIDPGAALAETRRVLRPGGRVALAVWGSLERNPYFAILGMSLITRGHVPLPEPPPAPGPFSMADPQRVTGLLRSAGFDDVRTQEVPVRFVLPDSDEYLNAVGDTAGPIGLALRSVPEDERAAIKSEAENSLSRFAADEGYVIPGVALCAVAS